MPEVTDTTETSNQTSESQEQTTQTSESTSDTSAGANDENQVNSGKPDESDSTSSDEDALAGANDENQATSGKPDESKDGKEAVTPDKSVAPESYSDFDLPDGIEMNKSYMDKVGPIFKELNLSQDQAQKLISAHVSHVQEGEAGRTEQVVQLHKDWLNEAKADKDIGGDNFDKSLKAANAAVNQFGSQDFKHLLRVTGLGNNKEIIRVFSKIGGLLKEDVPGDNKVTATSQKVDVLTAMYPDDVPK